MDENSLNIIVSPFDYSVENHFNAINSVAKLCKTEEEAIDQIQMELLSSTVTFLREWKDFKYNPRILRFSCETEDQQGKHVIGEVNLSQFSAAIVPKMEKFSSESKFSETRDFVLNVGGHVWALDWCPTVHQHSDCHIKCEYLAVAAHPPGSSYHTIGVPLSGRGVIQIWCIMHAEKEEESPPLLQMQKGKARKQVAKKKDINSLKRPRGRPRKESLEDPDTEDKMAEATLFPLCNREENKPRQSKRPRKPKDMKDYYVDFDTGNEPIPALTVDMSHSSEFLALTEFSKSTEEPAQLRHYNSDVVANDLNKEIQISQPTAVKFGKAKETMPLPLKKQRRPKKQKDKKEFLVDLYTENKSVPALSGDTSHSFECLALTEFSRSTEEPALLGCHDSDIVVTDSNTETQIAQATAVKFGNAKETMSLPLKTQRGRSRKQKGKKESLGELYIENEPVPVLAIDHSQVLSGVIAFSDVSKSIEEEHALQRSCYTDVVLDDSNRESQMDQATTVQVCHMKEKKAVLSKKSKRRPQKQNDVKDSLVNLHKENELVSEIAVDISQISCGSLVLTEGTKHVMLESCDTNVVLDNSNIENEMVQETALQLNHVKGKEPPRLKKASGPKKKKPGFLKDFKESLIDKDTESEPVPAVVVDPCHISSESLASSEVINSREEQPLVKDCDTNVGLETERLDQCIYRRPTPKRKTKKMTPGSHADGIAPALDQGGYMESFGNVLQGHEACGQKVTESCPNVANTGSVEGSTSNCDPPKDVAMPRVLLCLAHNGKVAWDVKWRPCTVSNVQHTHRMGYLAVLLGNGSLEVWEVPSPRAMEIVYSSCKKEGTDPRFVKLEPVFRCSKLKSGDRHSIPITAEWSTSSPHDLLLAGCHDGTVALWKFSTTGSSQDTRPLLCFSADTLPIRSLAWAPDESDEESANVVVTAGDGGIRFWDIRDPYRPLWDINLVRRFIYSLDWLQDPRCLILSFDDGTLKTLSLSKAAYDVPVTGKPFVGTQLQGLHSNSCSSFAIWSVHVSRLTGEVVYCSADGSILHFQLTSKAVDKDHSRYRAPHYLCWSLTEENTALTVNTPLPNIPFQMKKSLKESGVNPKSLTSNSDLKYAERANDQTPDHEPLALCYDVDPSLQTASEDTMPLSSDKTTSKTSKKRMPDSVSVQVDNLQKKEVQEKVQGFEVFPPKSVAMHRVRWNMNKGSERWLCSGGAAGIVRCQEVSIFSNEGRSLVKR